MQSHLVVFFAASPGTWSHTSSSLSLFDLSLGAPLLLQLPHPEFALYPLVSRRVRRTIEAVRCFCPSQLLDE